MQVLGKPKGALPPNASAILDALPTAFAYGRAPDGRTVLRCVSPPTHSLATHSPRHATDARHCDVPARTTQSGDKHTGVPLTGVCTSIQVLE